MAPEPQPNPIDRMLGSKWKVLTGFELDQEALSNDMMGGRRIDLSEGETFAPLKATTLNVGGDRCLPLNILESQEDDHGSVTEVQIQAECFPILAEIEAGKGVGLLLGTVEDGVAQVEGVATATWGIEIPDALSAIVVAIEKAQEGLVDFIRRGIFPFQIIGVFKPGVAHQLTPLFDKVPNLQFVMGGEFAENETGMDVFLDVISPSVQGKLYHVDNVIPVDDDEDTE